MQIFEISKKKIQNTVKYQNTEYGQGSRIKDQGSDGRLKNALDLEKKKAPSAPTRAPLSRIIGVYNENMKIKFA